MGKGAVQTRGRAPAGSRVADAVQLSLSVISHSGQASPIPSRTSAAATAAASDEPPAAALRGRWRRPARAHAGRRDPASNHETRKNPTYVSVGNKLAEWLRGLGIKDERVQPNHGWRHRFKTIGRECGMDWIKLEFTRPSEERSLARQS
jgi:hypothetical protein